MHLLPEIRNLSEVRRALITCRESLPKFLALSARHPESSKFLTIPVASTGDVRTKLIASPTVTNSRKNTSSKYDGSSRETISKFAWRTAVSVACDRGMARLHVHTENQEVLHALDVSTEKTITYHVAPAVFRMLSIGQAAFILWLRFAQNSCTGMLFWRCPSLCTAPADRRVIACFLKKMTFTVLRISRHSLAVDRLSCTRKVRSTMSHSFGVCSRSAQ